MASRLVTAALLLTGTCFIAGASGKGVIDPSLSKLFFAGGDDGNTENVEVSFDQNLQSVFDQVNSMTFADDGEKRTVQTRLQKTFTEQSQRPFQTLLRTRGVPFDSYWINNRAIVKNASPSLVNAISNVPGVAKVEKEPVFDLSMPFVDEPVQGLPNASRSARQSWIAWGVEKIRANVAWNNGFTGRGAVIGIIDTGVRYTHDSLSGKWRENYGWWDPYRRTSTPVDEDGHGTHVAGTILGRFNVGVAPDAQYIACRGCRGNSCGGNELYSCGQFMQCPTRPNGQNQDCSQAPKVVSNSWGRRGSSNYYDDIIRSWRNVGIIPVFSIGNSGPNCNTAGSPGERQGVIGVGSTETNERISSFSSLGPAGDGNIKPDIAAPGGRITSAWHTADNEYNTISGTSMACPHVSGVIGLMIQKRRNPSYDQVYSAITRTTVKSELDTSNARTCGGRSGSSFPNNVFGHGRIDAVNSVNAI